MHAFSLPDVYAEMDDDASALQELASILRSVTSFTGRPIKQSRMKKQASKRQRKRGRRFRPEPEHYRNPLALPFLLSMVLLFMPVLYIPFLFPAVNRVPWATIPVTIGWFALTGALLLRSALHFHWYVGRDHLRSVTGRAGASITRVFENQGFVDLTPRGPFVVVRHTSGKTHVLPRWLRSQGKTFRWELREGRLRLRGPDSDEPALRT